jgi:uncharacterized membrane protein YvlD (DUF360 family)
MFTYDVVMFIYVKIFRHITRIIRPIILIGVLPNVDMIAFCYFLIVV